MGFYLSILTFTCITVIAVTGVYVLTGLTGLFSLGQGAFMAIGAYITGVLVVKYNVPFIVAVCIAFIIGLFVICIVGLPTVRLRRDYIALVTFGFGEAITALLRQSAVVTGGAMGLSGIPRITTPLLSLLSAVIILILARNFKYSKYGRQCIALREDELAAKSMGINVPRIKMVAFILSALIIMYAGILYAFYTRYVEPAMFGWTLSAEWIIIVFVGGINSLTGVVFSSILLSLLPEFLRFASEWRIAAYSILVILILNFRPMGLFGEYEFSPKTFWNYLMKSRRVIEIE